MPAICSVLLRVLDAPHVLDRLCQKILNSETCMFCELFMFIIIVNESDTVIEFLVMSDAVKKMKTTLVARENLQIVS